MTRIIAGVRNIRPYKRIPLEEKGKILQGIKNGEKYVTIAADYGVTPVTISLISKNRKSYLQEEEVLNKQHGNKTKSIITGHEDSEFEKSLFAWVTQQRNIGVPVSGPLIKKQAREKQYKKVL